MSGGKMPFSAFNQTFSPVWCNVYDWMSCNYHVDSTQQTTVSAFLFQAPVKFSCQSDRCDFTNAGSQPGQLFMNGQSVIVPFSLNRNDVLSTNGGSTALTYNVVNQRLVWCGGAACDAATSGSPVAGANGCAFITDKTIYSTSGAVLRAPSASSISYTIPPTTSAMVWNGQQFICGNQYAECNMNTDCRAGHTYSYTYNGQVLGAEAQNGQLQIYGCVSVGQAPTQQQLDYVPSAESRPGETAFNTGSRCQVIQTQTVQCIPGSTSCGANAQCDSTTFTCKQTGTVSCVNDAQCGVGQVYDQATKTYYHYACQNPRTTARSCQRVADKKVECAYNSECATNWFCDVGGTCREGVPVKQQCTKACCDGDANFFDKPAPPGNVCCPGGLSYAPTLAQCGRTDGNPSTPAAANFDWLPWLFVGFAGVVLVLVIIKKRSGG